MGCFQVVWSLDLWFRKSLVKDGKNSMSCFSCATLIGQWLGIKKEAPCCGLGEQTSQGGLGPGCPYAMGQEWHGSNLFRGLKIKHDTLAEVVVLPPKAQQGGILWWWGQNLVGFVMHFGRIFPVSAQHLLTSLRPDKGLCSPSGGDRVIGSFGMGFYWPHDRRDRRKDGGKQWSCKDSGPHVCNAETWQVWSVKGTFQMKKRRMMILSCHNLQMNRIFAGWSFFYQLLADHLTFRTPNVMEVGTLNFNQTAVSSKVSKVKWFSHWLLLRCGDCIFWYWGQLRFVDFISSQLWKNDEWWHVNLQNLRSQISDS